MNENDPAIYFMHIWRRILILFLIRNLQVLDKIMETHVEVGIFCIYTVLVHL